MVRTASIGLLLVAIASLLVMIPAEKTCKRLRIKYCNGLGYRQTYKTNLVKQASQRDVAKDNLFQDLQTLDKIGCSDLVKPLACSIYAPKCIDKWGFLPPCRSVCTSVLKSCQKLMLLFSKRKTKAKLDCSMFPEPGPTTGCVNWTLKDFKFVMEIKGTPTKKQRDSQHSIPDFYKSG